MGKTFVEDERPCDSCVNVTRYGCVSWNCEYINRDEAIKAWREKHEMADRKTENSSEKPNNCEPKICDTCRYYNSNIPCGSTPSACKEADKFAEEFVDGLKKLKPKVEPQTSPTISKMEQVEDEQITSKLIDIENSAVSGYESTMSQPKSKLKDEPQTDCAWK